MSDHNLETEISSLREELNKLNSHRFIKIHNSMLRMLGFQFMRGLAFGLGSVFGATVLVSILVYFLSTIDFIPIVGEWAKEILAVLQPPK